MLSGGCMAAGAKVLVVDVGNTRTSIGWSDGRRIVRRLDIKTYAPTGHIKKILRSGSQVIKYAIICSVVPRYSHIVNNALKAASTCARVFSLKDDVKPIIITTYKSMKSLGADRIANICYGLTKYGKGVLIFDFGTALTCDWIDGKGRYRGGVIVPGMGTALEAVCQKAALLPQVRLGRAARVRLPGSSTVSSLRAGAIAGYAGVVEGLVRRFEALQRGRLKVIVTGGEGALLRGWVRRPFIYDRDVTLKGILAAYRLSQPH